MIRIMIIDDEPHTRVFLREKIPILNADCIVAACCNDGSEALTFLAKNDILIDLILSDIKMPVMDGLAFSRIAREKYPNIPIIILSGFSDFDYAKQAIQSGVSDYILKPIVNTELKQLLKKMVNQIESSKIEKKERKQKEHLLALFLNNQNSSLLKSDTVPILNNIKIDENPDIVEAAMSYILKNYSKPISLSMVADEIGVSDSYLSGIFHHKTGESYVKFLTKVRMEIAADYLDDYPNMLISDIAERTGFISIKHFFYVFKKFFKMTPTEYKQRKKEKSPIH